MKVRYYETSHLNWNFLSKLFLKGEILLMRWSILAQYIPSSFNEDLIPR